MAVSKTWAKAKFFIGTNTTALASETAWTEVKGWVGGGPGGGGEFAMVDTSSIDDEVETSQKGSQAAGESTITVIANPADAGQIACAAAAAVINGAPFNFKFELADDAVSAGNNPTKWTFTAHVRGFALNPANGRNARVEKTLRLAKQTLVTETAAAA